MSAAVLAFPSLLTEPVLQHSRRGRLPTAIGSLRQAAARRAAESLEAQASDRQETVEDVCRVRGGLSEIALEVVSHQITGVTVVGITKEGKRVSWLVGGLVEKPKLAATLLRQTLPRLARL